MRETVSIERLHRIADAAGIRRLPDTRRRVRRDATYRLWERALAATGDAALPFRVASEVTLAELGVYGFAILTAPTVGAALSVATRYFAMVNATGAWTMRADGDLVVLRWSPGVRDRPGAWLSSASVVAHFAQGAAELSGRALAPARVQLCHTRRAVDELCGCPVEYGAEAYALSFRRDLLDAAPRYAQPQMHAFFRGQCEAEGGPPPACAIERVDRVIERLLPDGDASADAVAAELGVSRRTLHRRLSARGASFRGRLDHVRRSAAARLVADSQRSLTEIAFDLGFADLSSLSRAFRAWFGQAPSSVRRDAATAARDSDRRGANAGGLPHSASRARGRER